MTSTGHFTRRQFVQLIGGLSALGLLEPQIAATHDLAARIWTGIHFPLGSHGNFSTNSFLTL